MEVKSRVIGGGTLQGKPVVVVINDDTEEIKIIFKGEHNDNL